MMVTEVRRDHCALRAKVRKRLRSTRTNEHPAETVQGFDFDQVRLFGEDAL